MANRVSNGVKSRFHRTCSMICGAPVVSIGRGQLDSPLPERVAGARGRELAPGHGPLEPRAEDKGPALIQATKLENRCFLCSANVMLTIYHDVWKGSECS